MNFIQADDLKKSYRVSLTQSKVALSGLSFEVPMGKVTGFVGSNGAGKSTTLKCLLGFVRLDHGQLKIFEKDHWDSSLRRRVGYLPERPYYQEFLSADQFLKMHWNLLGGQTNLWEEEVHRVLELVELVDSRFEKLSQFSKGMLQRVGVAQALLGNPDCLIFDEPMSGLDPDGRWMMKEIFQSMKQQGKTVFYSSHLINDMDQICDRIVAIEKGKLLFQGLIKDFKVQNSLEESYQTRKKEFSV